MRRAAASLVIALLAPGAVASASGTERAAENYVLHCSGCHGPEGYGTPGVTPTLHGLVELAETDAGRSYLARVPGVAQAPLSDTDLTALLDWMVARFSNVDLRPRFRAEDVARLRANPLRDPLAARRALSAETAHDRPVQARGER